MDFTPDWIGSHCRAFAFFGGVPRAVVCDQLKNGVTRGCRYEPHCDFTYPTEYIPVLRRIIEEEGADVVNCARTRSRPAAMPLPNHVANRAFAAMAHLMHGIPTCDVHSGIRAYRSSVIRSFDFDGEGDALPIDTLLFPAKCVYRVIEMPIAYHERVGQSKLRKLAGTVWTMIRLFGALPVGKFGGARGAEAGYEVR
ncbi:hypothetical protein [Sorangium sp. So ce341]|uniref:hypothetical protein n=1 Tax=Sorangium sp. So ce341 TaxID=3133302 RepID=UPI003F62999C